MLSAASQAMLCCVWLGRMLVEVAACAKKPSTLFPMGHSMLAELRQRVKGELQRPGNWHWGDQLDVQNLSEALDIGVLMFCDQLQDGGRQCLYNIGSQREDYPFWIALWWDEPVHFRLAQFSSSCAGGDVSGDDFVSFWSAAELPAAVLRQYQICNRLAT